MNSKYLYLSILVLSITLLSSCVVKKHTYYDYSTQLPGYIIYDYDSIDKKKYKDYFLNEFYLTVNVTSSDYYPSKKRSGAPYYLWFYGVSKNHRYIKMRIENCKIISSKKGNLEVDWLPIEYDFDNGTMIKTDIYYYSPVKHDTHEIDLDIDANEILELDFDLELTDSNGETYRKSMHFEIKPDIKTKYFDTIIERM